MAEGDQDKSEQPTPYRLEEARKRGEVARSQDVAGIVVMGTFACVLALTAAPVAMRLADATRGMIRIAAAAPAPGPALFGRLGHLYAPVGQALAPLLLALLVAAVLGNVMQTGLMFTTHPLKPDFKRMNPANAFKRMFSLRSLWELGKLAVKFVLLGGVCALFLHKAGVLVEATTLVAPRASGALLLSGFGKASMYVLLVLALVALTDLLFSRREFTRKMRMSKRELKDEIKRRDGDPAIKSKRREQLRELLKKARSLGRVAEADMVLTNPTHVAVALRYRPGQTLGPVVVAKGAGLMAARIRTLAARHRVPAWPSRALARALYRECGIDQMVPEHCYKELAPLYRQLWARTGTPT